MPKHKSEDYKLSAVQYYLENDVSYAKTCEIFKCSERSLKRWIDIYLLENSIKRHNRLSVSYKVTKKVISGTSSVGKLQCHSTSMVEATQSKFTRLETVKPCLI